LYLNCHRYHHHRRHRCRHSRTQTLRRQELQGVRTFQAWLASCAAGSGCRRTAPALERFAALPPSPLEKLERLEQLRLLENGIAIFVAGAPRDTIGVDTEEDLVRAEAVLKNSVEIR
jgi:hypothetical protein